MRSFRLLFLSLLSLSFLAGTHARAMSWDAQARLLGGFTPLAEDLADPGVATVMQSAEWRNGGRNSMAAVMSSGKNLFSRASRKNMAAFFSANLGPAHQNTRGLLYFFGGPDVLYPNLLFPNFEHILLVGLESPGSLADPERLLSEGRLGGKMGDIATAYRDIVRLSYFITSNMAKDLQEFGTSTMIAVGLVANGFRITAVEEVSLDAGGNLVAGQAGRVRGVREEFVKPNGQVGDVVYLRFDLSDRNRKAVPEFERFVKNGPYDTAFYKAASFVSHNGGFAGLNRLVLNKVSHVVQSDDGIPFRAMREQAAAWDVRLFGIYTPPARIFGVSSQSDLAAAFQGTLCGSASTEDQALWASVWARPCEAGAPDFGFASLGWNGEIPFRYGYAAVSGPGIVPWDKRSKFGTLILLDRR